MAGRVSRTALLKTRLARFSRTIHGVEHGDVRALHRARVASRRLRELVPVLELDHDVARKLARRLRRVTSRLGIVRELDVLLMLVNELQTTRPNLAEALQRVAIAVTKARDAARKKVFDELLPVSEMHRVSRKLDRVVQEIRWQEGAPQSGKRSSKGAPSRPESVWRWAVDARVANRAERLRVTIRAAGNVYLPERLHEVRIALKKLRYATELLAAASGEKSPPSLRVLKSGQDALGRMHDLQVLIDRVREVQASLSPPDVNVWHALDALLLSLENDCRRLHGRYIAQRAALVGIATKLAARSVHASGRKAG